LPARRGGRAEVTLVAGPVHLPTPRGVRASTCSRRADAGAVSPARQLLFIATGGGGRLAPGQYSRPEDQEGRLGRSAGTGFVENPDILAAVAQSPRPERACTAWALPPKATICWQHASAKRLRKDVPLLVGNIGPATFGRTTTRCCWSTPRATASCRARPRRAGAQLVDELARRLAAAPGAERVPPLLTCLKIAHHTSNYDGPRGGDYVRYVDSCCVPVRCTAVPSMG
jgi:phosphopantothenoylcysteine decarboxylase/phosphopantothenate--cysteine ligase